MDQLESAGKKKSFEMRYYIDIFATLCVIFPSTSKATNVFPKYILKARVINQFKQRKNNFRK